jgi:hypothetical protein
MKRFNLILLALGFLSFGLLMTSCKKDDETTINDADTTTAEYDALIENIFDDIGNISDEAYSLSTGNFKSTDEDTLFLGNCATITLDTAVFPRELIIDFGEENCLCRDGRYRRGKIINTFTGRYYQPGTVRTHGFDEFYVNDNKVEGSRVLINMGYNEDENLWFTIEVEGLITLAETGNTISWNSSKEREWVEGGNTWYRWDDVYLTTGTASGVRPSGDAWTKEIIIPLRRKLVCRFFVSGSVEIIPESRPARLLDYGDGECDNLATVTINGKTHTIHLR